MASIPREARGSDYMLPVSQLPTPLRGPAGPRHSLPIHVDEIYTLAEFQRRTGLGRHGVRAARRRGLSIGKCGRNSYVAGADWADYLHKTGQTNPNG